MTDKHSISIVMAIRLADTAWRDFLSGFLQGVRHHPHWNLVMVAPEEAVRAVAETQAAGLVIGSLDAETARGVNGLTLPTLVIGRQSAGLVRSRRGLASLHNDDEDIGRTGAAALSDLGDRNSWGFVPEPAGTRWSELREKGFVGWMRAHGKRVSVCRTMRTSSHDERARLTSWLNALPKPTAVMTAFDMRAIQVLEACKSSGLNVPDEVAVLCVDNGGPLCEQTQPALSSISPDHIRLGEMAAETLARLIRRRPGRAQTVLNTQKRLLTRESTQPSKPAAALIRRALAYIAENASRHLRADDIARQLGVSRQLIELRFREYGETSLGKTIRNERLKKVRQLLRETRLSVAEIAENCGWSSACYLEGVFRRRFGQSMSAFRRSCRKR